MKNRRMKVIICLFVLASVVPVASWAYGNDGEGKRRKGPPQEAIEACQGKQVGDSVEFTGRRGETLTATCEERRDQLVAVPEGMRDRIRQDQR
jgi:hypothetical protein